jgi:hypothetical protein
MSDAKVPSQRPRTAAAPAEPQPFARVAVGPAQPKRQTLDMSVAPLSERPEPQRHRGIPSPRPAAPEPAAKETMPPTYVDGAAPPGKAPRVTQPALIAAPARERALPFAHAAPSKSAPRVQPERPFAPAVMPAAPTPPSGDAALAAAKPHPAPREVEAAASEGSSAQPARTTPAVAAFASLANPASPSLPSPWLEPTPRPQPAHVPPPMAPTPTPPPSRSFASGENNEDTTVVSPPPPGARSLPYLVAGLCFLVGVLGTITIATRLAANDPRPPAPVAATALPPAPTAAPAPSPEPTPEAVVTAAPSAAPPSTTATASAAPPKPVTTRPPGPRAPAKPALPPDPF